MATRRQRATVLAALVPAIILFPVACLVIGALGFGLILVLGQSVLPRSSEHYFLTLVGILVAANHFLAYLAARRVYMNLRWETVDDNHIDRYCIRCNYDLIGNVSGTCPECGRPCNRRVQAHTPR
jgi:hypothetical protein